MEATPTGDKNWIATLALETAMGYYTPQELQLRSGQPAELVDYVQRSEEFKTAVTEYRRELHEGTTPLKTKANRLLWDTIGELKTIARDGEVAPADRIAAIREIAKLAGAMTEAPAAQASAVVQIVQFGPPQNGQFAPNGAPAGRDANVVAVQ